MPVESSSIRIHELRYRGNYIEGWIKMAIMGSARYLFLCPEKETDQYLDSLLRNGVIDDQSDILFWGMQDPYTREIRIQDGCDQETIMRTFCEALLADEGQYYYVRWSNFKLYNGDMYLGKINQLSNHNRYNN